MASRKTRPHSRAQRKLSFESLELRRVLAGNVVAALSGANLLITGDSSDNAIDVAGIPGSPGRVRITPQLGTTLNGQSAPLTFPSFGDIRFALNGGDDTLNFIGNPGPSDSLPGSLVVDGGEGDNTISVSNYDVGANVTIRNGTGSDSVTLTNTHAGKDITNGASGLATQTTSIIEGTTSAGDVRISNLNGSDAVTLGGTVAVSVGRDLSISNLGTGLSDTASITLANITVGRHASLINRNVATIAFGGLNGPATITHNTSIYNGTGDNSTTLSLNSSFGSVAGDHVTILNGAGNNTVLFDNVTINGSTDVRNGAGDATITAQASTTFNGALNIVTGKTGTHTIDLQDGAVLGALTIYNGNGTANSVQLGSESSITISGVTTIYNNTATTNSIRIDNGTLIGVVTLVNGVGIDTVDIGSGGDGSVSILNNLAIYNNAGASTAVNIDATSVTGTCVIRDTTANSQTISLGAAGSTSTGALNITTLGGDCTVTLDRLTVTGNAVVRTSAGNDTISLGGDGAAGLTITGTTTVDAGAGNDALTIGSGVGVASLLGFISIRMGFGTDNVTIGPNTSNAGGTAIAAGLFYFDGGNDPLGSNTITVNTAVVDPFVNLLTFNKFRNFVIVTIP